MIKRGDWKRVSARAAMSVALGVGGAASIATEAFAQQQEGDIVVTATRRATALQDVPIAVTPVTAEMIQNSGIRDIQDLTSVAPSLQFNVSENEASATARLRGIGTQGSNPGLESAVGIFIDGVYRARNGVALGELGEVQQIEVLRGPQGTLFGRNTSAGLITITTVAPSLTNFEAFGEATFGAFNEQRLAVGANFPLVENVLGARIFVASAERDGFMDMNPDGANPLIASATNLGSRDQNTRDVFTMRGQLLWQMAETVDLRLILDYSERDETCCAAQIYNPALLNGNPVRILSATGTLNPPIPYGFGRQQWIANLGGYGPNVAPATPLGAQGNGDIGARTGFANRDYTQRLEDYGVSGELNWDTALGTFTSITAYRSWTSRGGTDADFSQVDLVYVPAGENNSTRYQTFTQEFRLAGEAGPVDWLFGVFISDEQIDRRFSFLMGEQYGAYFLGLDDLITNGVGAPTAGLGVAPPPGSLGSLYNGIGAIPAHNGQRDVYRQQGNSIAFFTHNIWSITETTELTLGARFTREEKTLTGSFNTSFNGAPLLAGTAAALPGALFAVGETGADFGNCDVTVTPVGVGPAFSARTAVALLRSGYCVPWLRADLDAIGYNQERSENEWSGVLSLRQQLGEGASIYASYSRGYKGGGFNLDRNFDFTIVGGAPNSSFDAEIVDAYEIGLKTQWFDNALLLNVAVFRNEFENFQLNTFNGIQFVVTTVPEVISEGVEVDFLWRTPLEGLSIQGGVAYVDAVYGDNSTGWVAANRNPITGEQTLALLPGSQLTNAPQWTATAALTYERPLFNGSMLGLAYLDARWVDDQNTGSDLRASKVQPAYALVNARLGLSSINQTWSLEFWARNLLDEEYAQIMFDVPLQLGAGGPSQGAFLGDPRTYGVTLRARY